MLFADPGERLSGVLWGATRRCRPRTGLRPFAPLGLLLRTLKARDETDSKAASLRLEMFSTLPSPLQPELALELVLEPAELPVFHDAGDSLAQPRVMGMDFQGGKRCASRRF